MADEVRKLIPRTADGAFRLDLDYFDFHGSARRSFSDRFVALFGPPRHPYEPIDLASAEGPALRRLRGERAARARGHIGRHRPRPASADRPCRPLLRRRRRAERRRQRPHPARIRLRAAVRADRAGRCRLRARRGLVRRPHPFRQSRPRPARPRLLGAGGRRRRAGADRRRGRACGRPVDDAS